MTGALGSTLTVALMRLDLRSLGSLEPHVRRLRSRLENRLDPDACWEVFRDELGSELGNRSSRMLVDGVGLGGNPEKVGQVASDYSMHISLLRAKRNVAASTFSYLCFPLHVAMVGLMVFILEVMTSFNTRLTDIAGVLANQTGVHGTASVPNLPMFAPKDLSLTSQLLMLVILGLTIGNSMAPKFATGGHNLKVVFYASINCIGSGALLMVIPPIAQKVLS